MTETDAPVPPSASPSPSRFRRLGLRLGLAVLVCAGLGLGLWTLPSAGFRWSLIDGLRRLGMVEVLLAQGDLALFGGRVTVRDMAARPSSGDTLTLEDLAVHFQWRPLLHRQISFSAIALKGLSISVERRASGWVINGLPLAVGGGKAAEPGGAPPSPWGIAVESLEVSDSRLAVVDGEARTLIQLDHLVIDHLRSWETDSPTRISLDGRIGPGLVHLEGTATPLAAQPAFQLHLSLQSLDAAKLPALAKRVAPARLDGVLSADLQVEGKVAGRPVATVSGTLGLQGAGFAQAETRLRADHIGWTGKADLGAVAAKGKAPAGSVVGLDGSLTVEAADVVAQAGAAGGQTHFQADRIEWTGKTDLAEAGGGESGDGPSARLAGTLALNGIAVERPEDGGQPGLRIAAQGLRLAAESLAVDPQRLVWQGGLSVQGARLALPPLSGQQNGLVWSGRVEAALATPQRPHWDGRLEISDGRWERDGLVGLLRHGLAEGRGEGGDSASLTVRLEGLAASQPQLGEDWFAVDSLQLAALRLSSGQTSAGQLSPGQTSPGLALEVEGLTLDGVSALRHSGGSRQVAHPWRLGLRQAGLDHLALAPGGAVSLGELRLMGPRADLLRTKSGFAGFIALQPPADSGKPAPSPGRPGGQEASSALPVVSLGRLLVSDGALSFEDRTPADPVRLKVEGLGLTLARLDTTRPQQDSPLTFEARIGQARLTAQGALHPFATPLGGSVDGEVNALELLPLSPYLAETLGLRLQSGQFDGKGRVAVTRGKLAGGLEVTLANLFIAEPDPHAPLAEKTQLPVATVLDLLRDDQNQVRLSFPLSGDLTQPDFDISDAVNQTIGGALRAAALTTLKVVFPLTALVDLVSDDGESHLGLEPVPFAAGRTELPAEQSGRLGTVADLLRQRPALSLTLCGVAVAESDWPALFRQSQPPPDTGLLTRLKTLWGGEKPPDTLPPPDYPSLQALADARGRAVKAWLAGPGGIDPSRLFECRGSVEGTGDKHPAGVELRL